jgi:hypothetical protein
VACSAAERGVKLLFLKCVKGHLVETACKMETPSMHGVGSSLSCCDRWFHMRLALPAHWSSLCSKQSTPLLCKYCKRLNPSAVLFSLQKQRNAKCATTPVCGTVWA